MEISSGCARQRTPSGLSHQCGGAPRRQRSVAEPLACSWNEKRLPGDEKRFLGDEKRFLGYVLAMLGGL